MSSKPFLGFSALLALLCAYPLKDRMEKRVVLVLSSIPISIVVNGFRIGMIEVLVEWYGQRAADYGDVGVFKDEGKGGSIVLHFYLNLTACLG